MGGLEENKAAQGRASGWASKPQPVLFCSFAIASVLLLLLGFCWAMKKPLAKALGAFSVAK
jgi:hypothetical protein